MIQFAVKEFFSELNQLRKSPSLYWAQRLKPISKDHTSRQSLLQAEAMLTSRPSVPTLKWSYALHMVADERAVAIRQALKTSTPATMPAAADLIKHCQKYAIVRGKVIEIIFEKSGSTTNTLKDACLALNDEFFLRRALLNQNYCYVGVGAALQPRTGNVMLSVVLAEDMINLVSQGRSGTFKRRANIPDDVEKYLEKIEPIVIPNPPANFTEHSLQPLANEASISNRQSNVLNVAQLSAEQTLNQSAANLSTKQYNINGIRIINQTNESQASAVLSPTKISAAVSPNKSLSSTPIIPADRKEQPPFYNFTKAGQGFPVPNPFEKTQNNQTAEESKCAIF